MKKKFANFKFKLKEQIDNPNIVINCGRSYRRKVFLTNVNFRVLAFFLFFDVTRVVGGVSLSGRSAFRRPWHPAEVTRPPFWQLGLSPPFLLRQRRVRPEASRAFQSRQLPPGFLRIVFSQRLDRHAPFFDKLIKDRAESREFSEAYRLPRRTYRFARRQGKGDKERQRDSALGTRWEFFRVCVQEREREELKGLQATELRNLRTEAE